MPNTTSRRNFIGSTLAAGVGVGFAGLTAKPAFAQAMGDRVLLFLVDSQVPGPPDPMQFIQPDPGLSELLDMFGGTETFDSVLFDAEQFYLQRFGIDFSAVESDPDGFKFLDGIMLMPIRINPAIRYTATSIGVQGNILTTALIRDAAFVAIVTGNNVTYFGDYGGANGIPAIPGDLLAFGAYSVPGTGIPDLVRYRAFEPMRGNPDGNVTIACELFESPFGAGLPFGIGKFIPVGAATHVFVRNVLTFPGLLTSI